MLKAYFAVMPDWQALGPLVTEYCHLVHKSFIYTNSSLQLLTASLWPAHSLISTGLTRHYSSHHCGPLVEQGEAKTAQFSVLVHLSLNFHRVRSVLVIVVGLQPSSTLGAAGMHH